MLKVAIPASNGRGEVGNDYAQAVASAATRLFSYLVLEPLLALLPHHAPSCLESVAQKFKALPFYQTVPNVGFVRVQG